MPKIIDNVQRRKQQLAGNPILAGQNVAMAIAAMKEGINSTAWESYMKQYARDQDGKLDPAQLARLMGNDDTGGDAVMDRKRCYLLGNALCTMTTITDLDYTVASIDQDSGCIMLDLGSPCDLLEDLRKVEAQPGG